MNRLWALIKRELHCLRHFFNVFPNTHRAEDAEIISEVVSGPYQGIKVRTRMHKCSCGMVFYKDENFDTYYNEWKNASKPK